MIDAGEAIVDVLVPVFNGYDALEHCLDALIRHTPPPHRILLLDDASTDPRVAPLLHQAASQHARIKIVTNPRNLGFVGNCNRGLTETQGDIVVLNADTLVTPGWLDRMIACQRSDERIAIVCPLSNNATLLSVPDLDRWIEMGPSLTPDRIAALIASCSLRRYPRLPTAHGFCMLIRREALPQADLFDSAFGRGYGEENDLSMRLIAAGYEIACADDAYVHHVGSASFGGVPGLAALRQRNARLLDRRWPVYRDVVAGYLHNNPMRLELETARASVTSAMMPGRRHVLQVSNRYESIGGVEEHVRTMAEAMRGSFSFTVLSPAIQPDSWADATSAQSGPDLRLVQYRHENVDVGARFFGGPATLGNEAAEDYFRQLVDGSRVDLIHLQSLVAWGLPRFADVAAERGIPVVMTAHDLHLLCPDYNMMLDSRKPCGKVAANGNDAECRRCLATRQDPHSRTRLSEPDIGRFLGLRREAVARLLTRCDAVIAPSQYHARRLRAAFPAELVNRLHVIPHGADVPKRQSRAAPDGKFRVCFVGRFNDRKGALVFLEAARRARDAGIEWVVLGPVDDTLEEETREAGVVARGIYRVHELAEKLSDIDLVVIPSIVEESFNLVLMEVQSARVPVAAAAIGAIPERILDGETGFLFPPGDVDALVALVQNLKRDPARLQTATSMLAARPERTAAQCAEDYRQLYERLLTGVTRKVPAPPASTGGQAIEGYRKRGEFHIGTAAYRRRAEWESKCLTELARLPAPSLQVIVVAATEDEQQLRHTLESVHALSPAPESVSVVSLAKGDAASRQVAFGAEWILCLRAGDRVHPAFLSALADSVRRAPRKQLWFAPHDYCTEQGVRYAPQWLPDWDPLLPRRLMPGGFCAVRRTALDAGAVLANDIDENARIAHDIARRHGRNALGRMDFVLGHCVDGDETMRESVMPTTNPMSRPQAYSIALERYQGFAAIREKVLVLMKDDARSVSNVFVPVGEDEWSALKPSLPATAAAMKLKPIPFDPFAPRGAWLNRALAECKTEWLVILRDDVTPAGRWADTLLAAADADDVAVVSGALSAGEAGIREGWLALGFGPDGVAGYPLALTPPTPAMDQPALRGVTREVSAFFLDCCALRVAFAKAVGGFETRVPASRHLAVDFSLRLNRAGLRLIATTDVIGELAPASKPEWPAVWHGGGSAEAAWMIDRHGLALSEDPRYPAALSKQRPGFLPEAEVCAPPGWEAARDDPERLRIVACPYDSWGSGNYRVRQPLEAMDRAGKAIAAMMPNHDSGRAPSATEMLRLAPDRILVHHFFHDYQLAAAAAWKRHLSSVPLVVGMDDLLTLLPSWNPYAGTLYPDIANRIARLLSMADRLVVSTDYLADAYRALCRDVRVVPNSIDESIWLSLAPLRKESPRIRVGWAGAAQHEGDLAWLEPVIQATCRQVDWVILGKAPAAFSRYPVELHNMVPFNAYPQKLHSLALDVGLAPLADHPFNHAKSAIKLLEYGILGVPVLASDVTPYRGAPVTRLPNKPEAWIDALLARSRSRDQCKKEGTMLQVWVMEHKTLGKHLDFWCKIFSR